ncbi:IS1 family transposase, partial [Escherichia coli]|uniref:IS1 family transposase n=1 Tax=Escherichia coli TaxID=562 RepID=UPI003D7B56AC
HSRCESFSAPTESRTVSILLRVNTGDESLIKRVLRAYIVCGACGNNRTNWAGFQFAAARLPGFSKSVELHDKVIGHYLNIKHYQ